MQVFRSFCLRTLSLLVACVALSGCASMDEFWAGTEIAMQVLGEAAMGAADLYAATDPDATAGLSSQPGIQHVPSTMSLNSGQPVRQAVPAITPVVLPQATSGTVDNTNYFSADCETRKQAVIATHIPPDASVTASQETVMWMTKIAISMIDDGCPGGTPEQRAAERQHYVDAYNTAEKNCNQVQSGERLCAPGKHF